MLIAKKRLNRGIRRLLDQPTDLVLSGATAWDADTSTSQHARHKKLFAAYVKELNKRIPATLEWWKELTDEAKEDGDEMNAWRTRPAGPASDPSFVALVRKYWLACAALNQEVPEGEQVPPEAMLLGWLIDAGHSDSVEVLACMPYWPIGLDREGNWC